MTNATSKTKPLLLVIGALHVDEMARAYAPIITGESNPVSWSRSVGGVAANAARAAATDESVSVVLIANAGDTTASDASTDSLAEAMLKAMHRARVSVRPIRIPGARIGRYSAVLHDSGELLVGLADVEQAMDIDSTAVEQAIDLSTADALVLDTNLSGDALTELSTVARRLNRSTLVAALGVSPAKINRLNAALPNIDVLFCNASEANAMTSGRCRHLVVTQGRDGVQVFSDNERTDIAVPPVAQAVSANGPGDALAGATLSQLIQHPLSHESLVAAVATRGIPAAALVVSGVHSPPVLQGG